MVDAPAPTLKTGLVTMSDRDVRDAVFAEFVGEMRSKMRRWAYLVCGDWDRAEDIVQSSLIKLYRHWGRVERADDQQAYARRIVVNAALDEGRGWRKLRSSESPVDVVPELPTIDSPESELAASAISAMLQLGPRQRAVIALRYFEDLSLEETAETLGVSVGTVKSQAARGLVILRRILSTTRF